MYDLRYLLAVSCEQDASIWVAELRKISSLPAEWRQNLNSMDATEYTLTFHGQFTSISFDILIMQEKISFIHQY